jgi:hypothetical protein
VSWSKTSNSTWLECVVEQITSDSAKKYETGIGGEGEEEEGDLYFLDQV